MPHDQCPGSRRGHTWKDHLPERSVFRAWNVRLELNPALRICSRCGARGGVDNQGRIIVTEPRGTLTIETAADS